MGSVWPWRGWLGSFGTPRDRKQKNEPRNARIEYCVPGTYVEEKPVPLSPERIDRYGLDAELLVDVPGTLVNPATRALGSYVMRTISLSKLLALGSNLRFVTLPQKGYLIKQKEGQPGVGILGAINNILRSLETFGFPVTLAAADDLAEFRDAIKDEAQRSRLGEEHVSRLREIMEDFSKVLFAEGKTITLFALTEKRIPNQQLLGEIDGLVDADVCAQLPDIAAYDLCEGAKCIAYDRPTGAAFHVLRATEAVLRTYYLHLVKRKRLPENKRTWGAMLHQLKPPPNRKRKPPRGLMGSLEHIRVNFRNPTTHPEARHDIDSAQRLLNLCRDVITQMVRDEHWAKPGDGT